MTVKQTVIAFALVAVVVGSLAGNAATLVHFSREFEDQRSAWLADKRAAAKDLEQSKRVVVALDSSLGAVRQSLEQSVTFSRRLANEAALLRAERLSIVPVASVPGQLPTVGDTLAACRLEVGLCAKEADLQKQRADSLEQVAQSQAMEAGSLRGDLGLVRHSLESANGLLDRANTLLAAADAPCILAKAGPLSLKCPDRTTVALVAVGGTVAALGGSREQRVAGLGLVVVGIVW